MTPDGSSLRVSAREQIKRLKETNPEEARKLFKHDKWRDLVCSHKADLHGPIHALGLQRNPSRGRTHMFIQSLEYVSGDNSQPRRTRTSRCGVYKIQDMRNNIRRMFPGIGDCLADLVDTVYQNMERSPELVPIFLFILGADSKPDIKIGRSHISAQGSLFLRFLCRVCGSGIHCDAEVRS